MNEGRCPDQFLVLKVISAIHKASGLTGPGHSMTSTGTIPVEHWLWMGATGRNAPQETVHAGGILGMAGN